MACRGRLLRGLPLLRRLEALGTDEATERPTARVEVCDCGEMAAADVAALTELATGGDGHGAGAGAGAGAGGLALDMGGEALLEAAARGDASTARALLEAGVAVDAYGSRALLGAAGAAVEQTALHVAAQHGHREVVAGLLRAGADANLSDSEARAPPHRLQPHAAGLHPTRPGCNRVHPGRSPMHPGEHGAPPCGGRGRRRGAVRARAAGGRRGGHRRRRQRQEQLLEL
eukprot:scaffold6722_cov63-Phaeocystis_antarctica.AAC.2